MKYPDYYSEDRCKSTCPYMKAAFNGVECTLFKQNLKDIDHGNYMPDYHRLQSCRDTEKYAYVFNKKEVK